MENKPEPTIEDLLSFMNEMFNTLKDYKGSLNMSPDVIADIDKLEAKVATFKEDTEELLNLFDVDIQELQHDLLASPQIRSSDKQLIKRAQDVERQARVIKLALSKMRGTKAKEYKKRQGQPENQELKKQIKERRKLFKTIGGDQKWIPL